jgi:hypothetical protein
MLNFKWIRAALLAAAFAVLALAGGASPQLIIGKSEGVNEGASEPFSVLAEPADGTSTYYSVRRDLRRLN